MLTIAFGICLAVFLIGYVWPIYSRVFDRFNDRFPILTVALVAALWIGVLVFG